MSSAPDPPAEPPTTAGGERSEVRGFTTHPTGDVLAKDLRDVRSKPERAFNIGAVLGLTLAVTTFVFLLQNNGTTDFEWLWFDFELPLWTALVGALVTGALLVLTALAVHRRRKKRIGRRERAAGRLEEALAGGEPESGPTRTSSPPASGRSPSGAHASDEPPGPAGRPGAGRRSDPGPVGGPMG